MSGAAVHGEIGGVRFELFADDAPFLAYARAHLGSCLEESASAATVRSTLRWREGLPPRGRGDVPGEADRVDRDLYVGVNQLSWFRVDDLRDLRMTMAWEDGCLRLTGDFYFRLGNSPWTDRLRRLRQARQLPGLRRRRYPTLVSYLAYYPCWWWAEQHDDFHPIHAAGVATPRGTVLLAGASGVGKSTLATALAAEPESRILGDSFVLHHGREVRAVHEPILLDEWSRSWLGERASSLERMREPYMLGRQGFLMREARRGGRGEASLLLFPRRAARGYVRRIDARLAHQRLSAADLIINDLRRYFAFAAVIEHMLPCGLVARREEHLRELAASVPAYELGLPEGLSCDEAVARVRDLLAAAPAAEGA